MRKVLLASLFACAVPFGISAHASAASAQADCTGQYASTFAGPQFGPFVASYASYSHGLGQILGPSSRSNDCSDYPPPYVPAP